MPTEENKKFLDVTLDVTTYNCGLFKFDWELLRMVNLMTLNTTKLNYFLLYSGIDG